MKLTPYLETVINARVYMEIREIRAHQQNRLHAHVYEARDNPEEYATRRKDMLDNMESMRLDGPNYEKLRKKQLREWLESLPDMPPEELFA